MEGYPAVCLRHSFLKHVRMTDSGRAPPGQWQNKSEKRERENVRTIDGGAVDTGELTQARRSASIWQKVAVEEFATGVIALNPGPT